jgi:hypothetical protein
MKRLLIASIVLAMAGSAFAQSQTRPTQPQTRTSDPDSTMTEMQKGGPASKESKPGAGGQQTVTKPTTPNAGATPTPAPPR